MLPIGPYLAGQWPGGEAVSVAASACAQGSNSKLYLRREMLEVT